VSAFRPVSRIHGKPAIPAGISNEGKSMRDLRLPTALAGLVAVHGLATAPISTAAEIMQTMLFPGAVCQLSIPTTNTGVRPKATGFRNESTTTSNFVICPLVTPTLRSSSYDPLVFGYIAFKSLDGLAHSASCTAVTGGQQDGFPPTYSTRSIFISASGSADTYAWGRSDFGQSPGTSIDGSALFTITCNLPPQVQIVNLKSNYYIDIGS
jgi:hypothetical protein